jgi:SAM-dependent methyltransferase
MEKPQNIYDNKGFYKEYKEMREKDLNANNLIEIPTIKTMLPNLKGKRILDLGCGNGGMSKYFIENGAEYVLALDISKNMIEEAKQKNNHSNITYEVLGMEDLNKIKEKFDMVFSSLAFHYIEDFNKLINDISNLLYDGGILLFSQEHPIATAAILSEEIDKKIEINNKRYYLISDYNLNGKRKTLWNNSVVTKYHRNFSLTINTLIQNNFNIMEIEESKPSEEAIRLVEKYKYQNDRPYFLFIKAMKI